MLYLCMFVNVDLHVFLLMLLFMSEWMLLLVLFVVVIVVDGVVNMRQVQQFVVANIINLSAKKLQQTQKPKPKLKLKQNKNQNQKQQKQQPALLLAPPSRPKRHEPHSDVLPTEWLEWTMAQTMVQAIFPLYLIFSSFVCLQRNKLLTTLIFTTLRHALMMPKTLFFLKEATKPTKTGQKLGSKKITNICLPFLLLLSIQIKH